ncbi:MAG: 50S ribosomal protein L25 [Candidatus Omnitrophica bacterium]|nr:50S ribosomal protein L25 [Candidatus Omnitrophota bacterium]
MEQVTLSAEVRTELGKQRNKHLRQAGFVPAVVYRHGKSTLALRVLKGELARALHTERGENVVISLTVAGEAKQGKAKERLVMIKEIQHEPLHGSILHVDFHEISLSEKLKVNVPIEAKGESVGVKQDGGVLEHTLREVETECLPTQIPDRFEVDVSLLKIGDSLQVKDIPVPEGVRILSDSTLTIFTVKPPFVEKVAEVAPEGEVTEPEVIKQKKEEEEVAEGAEEAKKKTPPAEEAKKKPEAKGE